MSTLKKTIPSILLVIKKYLIIFFISFGVNIIFCRAMIVYYFVIINGAVNEIDRI